MSVPLIPIALLSITTAGGVVKMVGVTGSVVTIEIQNSVRVITQLKSKIHFKKTKEYIK
tara:strand:+ start:738 stop:914 length:177 start_codon:yes stop_codon:yes gene_type:complete